MASVNKVILIGRLGKDPELNRTPAGVAVANFSIATSEKFKDKNDQPQESTEWHSIVCWNRQAEIAHQYLKKGSEVYLEGKLTTRSWDDQNGQKRYKTEVKVIIMQFTGSQGGGGNSQQPAQSYGAPQPAPQQPYGSNYPQQGQSYGAPQPTPPAGAMPIDDDLPF